jgi:RNA polymerase sigma-70 factor (ECF subfamily)
MRDGPEQGLALMNALAAAGDLESYHLLHAARADLLRRLGRSGEAASGYAQALALVTNNTERRFLERRLREVEAGALRR